MQKRPPSPKRRCACGRVKEPSARACGTCHRAQRKTRWSETIREIALGRTVKEIALAWGISNKTVEYHWAVAKAACNFESPVDATHYALAKGWIKNKYL